MWLLLLITLSGTLAIHAFMPALPDAARSLHTTPGAIQSAVSLYILGLALGQPIYGPLSDAFGRRTVLLGGMALFTFGGLWAAAATSIEALATARFVQAFGGCSGLALGRAIVRDTSEDQQAVSRMALLNMIMLVGPGFAPVLGQLAVAVGGWRLVLLTLASLGAVNFLLSSLMLRETSTPTGHLSKASLYATYRRLLGSPAFAGYSTGGGCATTASFAFFSAAPFIFIEEFHRPASHLAIYLGVIVSGAALGNLLGGRLAPRFGLRRVMLIASAFAIASAGFLLVTTLAHRATWESTLAGMLAFTVSAGTIGPLAMTCAISIDPKLVGSAAGLYGAMQMLVGAVCTWCASLGSSRLVVVSGVLLVAAVIGQVSLRLALSRSSLLR